MCTVWAALFLFLSPFPFRYRFAALLRTPSPLAPSLSFIHLSLSSSLNHVPFFFFPAAPFPSPPLPSLRAVTLVFPDSPSSSVLLSPGASPFSCYLFVFCALSIFLPLLSPAPPIFPLPYAYRPCSVRLPPSASLFFNPFLPPRCSIFLPSVPLYIPRCLRRDGPIFSSRFLGSDIFYTFFSPSLPFDGYPCAALPRHRNIASSIRFISLSVVSHIRTWSLSLSSRLSSALFLLSFVHLSLPSHLSFIFPCLSPPPLSLSLLPPSPPPPPSTPAAPIFLIFFSQLPDHLPTPRVGVLFLSGRSSRPSARPRTRVHTYVRSQPAREGETER